MAGKIRHLLERDGRFYARLVIPAHLRPFLDNKHELREPLGDSRTVALRKHAAAVARLQSAIEAAREQAARGPKPVPRGRPMTVRQMARAHYEDQVRLDDEARNSDHRYAAGFIDERYVADLKHVVSGSASDREMLATIGRIISHFQRRGNTKAQSGTPEWRELARALASAELEALRRTAERDEGDFTGVPSDPILAASPPSAADASSPRILGPDSTKSLSELLPEFIKERGAKSATNREYKVAIRMFEEHLEEARPVYRITRQDVQAYKRALSETPASYTKRFPGMTLPDAPSRRTRRARNRLNR